ncbi:aldehyde dehydrogenase family protein [Rubrivirga sp. S365]|uniref:Aldehyde dehydrogenase family protein n=1 Tax=Rubrivirga litoralis TaxID=3075598 RepID=A0ABU3BNU7_9BACT|nr:MULTISPECIES: aldehyde dehydrogenase family protein [unclassified Rubrivirga]MDT0630958.1 aldehyde dehydrogenase family protein [Rubrivirga sp. F394]MDT7856601.1 aldehyde dehydrogenase family protein [Rubrivirga sp. S365]
MDADLVSIQEARDAAQAAAAAQKQFKTATQDDVDRIVAACVEAGAAEAKRLGQLAHDETGFGRPESKEQKNLFATRTLAAQMDGMRTAGIVGKSDDGNVWTVATPMGVVAALVPSTNPTATAFYKALIALKARCGIVMSPHPRAARCTAEALDVIAQAATDAGAPPHLLACLGRTDAGVTIAGTDALLEHPDVDVILATGGGAMVRAAYSKGKPAYGVGSGNVPVYVDRSANVEKAAADVLTGTSFDWGTLCSTERSVVADSPVRSRMLDALRERGGHVCSDEETRKLRAIIKPGGRFNTDLVGQSPRRIAEMAGFSVPDGARALVAEVDAVGPDEPLSMETLSPILSFYVADGWEAGCERCLEVLEFGGIGHTLALHATSDRVIEQFALKKPSMRIVVNTVAALGSVGMTTDLFPAMTLGPGTLGGSITSDNVTPLHLVNLKRVAFETAPLNDDHGEPLAEGAAPPRSAARSERARSERARPARATPPRPERTNGAAAHPSGDGSWMDEIEARLVARAGNQEVGAANRKVGAATRQDGAATRAERGGVGEGPPRPEERGGADALPLPEGEIDALVRRFRS